MAADGSVTRAARGAPEVLIRAVGHAGPVLDPHSPRRVELDRAASESEATSELCRALELFALARAVRVAALEAQKAQLAGLPVFDLFAICRPLHLRPVLFESGTTGAGEGVWSLRAFHALTDARIGLNEFIPGRHCGAPRCVATGSTRETRVAAPARMVIALVYRCVGS
jgi:hypothetical protein